MWGLCVGSLLCDVIFTGFTISASCCYTLIVFLLSCGCFVSPSRSAMGWSAVCRGHTHLVLQISVSTELHWDAKTRKYKYAYK